MSEDWKPGLGDVVTLAGAPQQPMTITGVSYETKQLELTWLDDAAHPWTCSAHRAALVKVVSEEPAPPPGDAQAGVVVVQLVERVRELEEQKERLDRLVKLMTGRLRDVIPREDWGRDPEWMAVEAMRRFEVMQREANEQIASLRQRLGV